MSRLLGCEPPVRGVYCHSAKRLCFLVALVWFWVSELLQIKASTSLSRNTYTTIAVVTSVHVFACFSGATCPFRLWTSAAHVGFADACVETENPHMNKCIECIERNNDHGPVLGFMYMKGLLTRVFGQLKKGDRDGKWQHKVCWSNWFTKLSPPLHRGRRCQVKITWF